MAGQFNSNNIVSLSDYTKREEEKAVKLRSLVDGKKKVTLKGENQELRQPTDDLDTVVMTSLKNFEVMFFDGDNYREKKWTKYVAQFLETHPTGIVIAFKPQREVQKFVESWGSVPRLAAHLSRMYLLTQTDEELKAAKVLDEYETCPMVKQMIDPKFVVLGREFLKATMPDMVLAIGGGRVARVEAELSWKNDRGEKAQKWTILNPPGGDSFLKQWVVDRAIITAGDEDTKLTKLSVGENFTMELIVGEEATKLKAQQCNGLVQLFSPSSPVSGYYFQEIAKPSVLATVWKRIGCLFAEEEEEVKKAALWVQKRRDVFFYYSSSTDLAQYILSLVRSCDTSLLKEDEVAKLKEVAEFLTAALVYEERKRAAAASKAGDEPSQDTSKVEDDLLPRALSGQPPNAAKLAHSMPY